MDPFFARHEAVVHAGPRGGILKKTDIIATARRRAGNSALDGGEFTIVLSSGFARIVFQQPSG